VVPVWPPHGSVVQVPMRTNSRPETFTPRSWTTLPEPSTKVLPLTLMLRLLLLEDEPLLLPLLLLPLLLLPLLLLPLSLLLLPVLALLVELPPPPPPHPWSASATKPAAMSTLECCRSVFMGFDACCELGKSMIACYKAARRPR